MEPRNERSFLERTVCRYEDVMSFFMPDNELRGAAMVLGLMLSILMVVLILMFNADLILDLFRGDGWIMKTDRLRLVFSSFFFIVVLPYLNDLDAGNYRITKENIQNFCIFSVLTLVFLLI